MQQATPHKAQKTTPAKQLAPVKVLNLTPEEADEKTATVPTIPLAPFQPQAQAPAVVVQAPVVQGPPDPIAPRRQRSFFTPFWKPTPVGRGRPVRFIRRKDPIRAWEKDWRLATGWGSRTWGTMAENVGEVQVRARRRRQKYIVPFPEDYPQN